MLNQWLAVSELNNDVTLHLEASDVYDAHAALRHAHELSDSVNQIQLVMPMSIRTHRGFTPWLAYARTVHRGSAADSQIQNQLGALYTQLTHPRSPQCILQLSTKPPPVRAQPLHVEATATHTHYASFDFRISGKVERTLADSGATCSCMTEGLAKHLCLNIEPSVFQEDIGGVGGEVSVRGTVTTSVKLGKQQVDQVFYVVKDPIAGYQCLLGQDFLAAHSCALLFSPTAVSLTVGGDAHTAGKNVFTRRIQQIDPSHSVQSAQKIPEFSKSAKSDQSAKSAKSAKSDKSVLIEGNTVDAPVQGRERKSLMHAIHNGTCVAFRVIITPHQSVAAAEMQNPIPPDVQAVIDKHSTESGTLRGTIPPNTHVKGYECHIDLVPGAQPVQIRQYRLTPREREELEAKVRAFIDQGWIEPSVSPWCSSVLFVPKPGGKLRFCVDYRRVNAVTQVDKHPIPQQEEIIDRLQGAECYTALDLASGFYQLGIDPSSRGITAFPTPMGLYQWRVMPMGLCNAPAVFQRAMNQILSKHIAQGYCLVYIDDIIIFSKSVEDHISQLDAVLSTLREHNLFCQLPKCTWAQKRIKYLGHIVDGTGVLPDPGKVKALDHWEPPSVDLTHAPSQAEVSAIQQRKVHECRRFLGFMNYFARFIPRYAEFVRKH